MSALTRHYRIGKVASMLGVRTSVLRFWETEFPELIPQRGSNGQRTYYKEDIDLLKRIKELLYVRGLTIEGARLALCRTANYKSLSTEQKLEHMARGEELEEKRLETARQRRENAQRRQAEADAGSAAPASNTEDAALVSDILKELKDIRAQLAGIGSESPAPAAAAKEPEAAASAEEESCHQEVPGALEAQEAEPAAEPSALEEPLS